MAIAASIAFALVVGWQVLPLDREPVASKARAALAGHAAGTTGTVPCTLRSRSPRSLWRRQPGAIARTTRHCATSLLSRVRFETERPKSLERIGAYSRAESFAHVVVRHRATVASILLTPVDQAPATHAQAAPCPSSEGFQVACFDARGHAGFVVSDLTDAENLELARDLAPVLQTYLRG